ncbi:MAG: hypothetical protein ACLFUT_02355, partial [Desulfobacteraceae bacterium]
MMGWLLPNYGDVRVLDQNFSAKSKDVLLKLSHLIHWQLRCQVSGVRCQQTRILTPVEDPALRGTLTPEHFWF